MPHTIPDSWERTHRWDFWAAYDSGEWEPETYRCISELVTEGSTYVDIGAWIGPTVLWAAPMAGRVIAIEPDPVARDYLRVNVEEHTNVEIVDGAIGATTGHAQFSFHSVGPGLTMGRLATDGMGMLWSGGNMDVATWTLPDFFDAFAVEDVSLVKMDIEGGEAEILEAVCPFLAEREIPLLVSIHPAWNVRPVERAWFDCFSEVVGDVTGEEPVLCLP